MILVCAPTHPALCPWPVIGVALSQGDIFPCRAGGAAVLAMPLHMAGCMVLPRSVEPGFPGLHKLLSLTKALWARLVLNLPPQLLKGFSICTWEMGN